MHEPTPEQHISRTPPRLELGRMPTDEELDAMGDDAGMPPPPGGMGDDDSALKGIRRRTTWGGRLVALALIAGCAGAGLFWYQGYKKHEARWDGFRAADQAPTLEAHLSALRTLYPTTEFMDVKVAIIRDFQKYRDPASVPVLITALDDTDVPVRRQAALALAEIGLPAAEPAKDKLLEHVRGADAAERPQIVWALAVLHDPRAADAIIAEFSQGTLQHQPHFDPKVITDVLGTTRLSSLVHSDSEAVCMLVAMALSEAATPEVVDPLSTLLTNSHGEVVEQAAAGLGRTGDPRAADKLFQALQAHPDLQTGILDAIGKTTGAPGLANLVTRAQNPAAKRELTRMLADTHDPRGADTLATLITDVDVEVKHTAYMGLAALGDPRATPVLLEVAGGPDDNKAREALGALRLLARPEMVHGLGEIMNTFPGRKADCLRALAASGSQEAGPMIERELAGDDIETAARALADLHYEPAYRHVLGMIHRPPDIDFHNLSAINETAYRNRLIAIHAVGRYGKPDAVDTLKTVVEDGEDEPRLREAAGMALGLVAPIEVMRDILAKVRNSQTDTAVRQYYTQGLWQRPNRELASQLLDLLDPATPDEVRRAACLAIGYAADPANDAHVTELLASPQHRTDASFVVVLGGTNEQASSLAHLLGEDRDTLELLQQAIMGSDNTWFDMVSPEMFTSGEVWRRLRVAAILKTGVGDKTYGFAEAKVLLALKNGWDGPGGMTTREIRGKLLDALHGTDADLRQLAARTLGGLGERGLLIAARDGSEPGAVEARTVLTEMNHGNIGGSDDEAPGS